MVATGACVRWCLGAGVASVGISARGHWGRGGVENIGLRLIVGLYLMKIHGKVVVSHLRNKSRAGKPTRLSSQSCQVGMHCDTNGRIRA